MKKYYYDLHIHSCLSPCGDDDMTPNNIAGMGVVAKLRNEGIYAETDLVGRSLKAQMKYADKIGAKYTLILGDSELESGKAQLKNMAESSQEEIEINDICDIIACK